MSAENLLWWIIVGLIAGFLAGQIMRGRGFGLVGNIIIGIVGAILGGLLFGGLIGGGLLGSIIVATLGAILLLLIISAVQRA